MSDIDEIQIKAMNEEAYQRCIDLRIQLDDIQKDVRANKYSYTDLLRLNDDLTKVRNILWAYNRQ